MDRRVVSQSAVGEEEQGAAFLQFQSVIANSSTVNLGYVHTLSTTPQPSGSCDPPPSGSYGPPSSGSYRPPLSGSYGPPPSGSYVPPLSGSYGPPPSGSYGPSSSSGSYGPPYTHQFQQYSPHGGQPYVLKFLTKQIRVCAGCRLGYCNTEKVPAPPYNICVAHEETRQINNSHTGVPFTTKTTAHYHANPCCIWMKDNTFKPENLHIPQEVDQGLQQEPFSVLQYISVYAELTFD